MSELTVKLCGLKRKKRSQSVWTARLDEITNALVKAHGVPHLGNFRDPVREIFYILLSAKTTDSQYQKTYRTLTEKFPTLPCMASAEVKDILACIKSGGLANKKASQIKRVATALLAMGGDDPAKHLRKMPAEDAFKFLTKLPGMGPKSALCVIMYSLDADVFPVDVNVQRIAVRLGVIPNGLKHYQAQRKLPPLVPAGRSRELHIAMVVHGREVCLPRKPKCERCSIRDYCRYGRKSNATEGAASV